MGTEEGRSRTQAEWLRLGGGAGGPGLARQNLKGKLLPARNWRACAAVGVDSVPFPSRDQPQDRLSAPLSGPAWRDGAQTGVPPQPSHVLLAAVPAMRASPRSFI